jgi:hypothetical protein
MSDFNQGGGTYSKLLEAQEKKQQSPAPASKPVPTEQDTKLATEKESNKSTTSDVTTSRNHESNMARRRDVSSAVDDDFIEEVRKAVRLVGTNNSSHRLTNEEKEAITDIIYALKKKGLNTNENQIARIAIDYLIADFRKNKQSSFLTRMLERLND